MKSELINHLEKLKYFKVVAERESFYRASLKLGISQPALTRSIQSLEYVLDTKLFNRNSRGVKITSQGENLLALANEIFLKVESWNSLS
ncbi:MAG: LysR family transcriptional regulator, partial [Bdellovibrionaceae bacterium]|nr:LysR family transcriptional regulator [Pseudobdellovibrionaceae bacterium]